MLNNGFKAMLHWWVDGSMSCRMNILIGVIVNSTKYGNAKKALNKGYVGMCAFGTARKREKSNFYC